MAKESFLLYKSFYEPIKELTLEQKGELLDALFRYQIERALPTVTDRQKTILPYFLFFKNQFTLDEKKYETTCEKNRVNGLLSAEAKVSKRNKRPLTTANDRTPTATNPTDNDNDNDKKNIGTVVSFLNKTCNSLYRANGKATGAIIQARFNDGFSVDDLKTVIEHQNKLWSGNEMEKYLRPETLFGSKFEGYLSDAKKKIVLTPVKNNIPTISAADFYGTNG